MSNPMRHDEVRELLAAQAIDLLAPDERSSVLEHIAACPECSEELEAFRATAAALALAAPDRSFDARRCNGVRSRL
ncbi:MAG TPA: zf-HC2 domain-containing protein, partial [Gemmatimonadaceae bacterium]|nr:zf-HC2 domain-containing protein [Gemmatimonadaceae bacterium]